jgi:glyoxylase-like metal-dependent hydrolase (beta-lactamase superfamily II)
MWVVIPVRPAHLAELIGRPECAASLRRSHPNFRLVTKASVGEADSVLHRTDPAKISEGVIAFPFPGHTQGSVLFLADERYCFNRHREISESQVRLSSHENP